MRRTFTLGKRLQILAEQERTAASNTETCRLHSLQLVQLAKWKRGISKALEASKRKKSLHTGPKSRFHVIEGQLLSFIRGQRQQRAVVNVNSIIRKMHELAPESANMTMNAKRCWTYRFLSRNDLSIRRVTRCVHLTDEVLQQRKESFLREVISRLARNPTTIFLNMDQTAIVHGDNRRLTIADRGSTAVEVTSLARQTDRVTVALAIASNGEKLSPFVIYKGTRFGRISREFRREAIPYPQSVNYFCNANAWMTNEAMEYWIDLVLWPYALTKGPHSIALLLDSFSVHQSSQIRSKITSLNIEVITIPGGLTGMMQPLDVGINAPFKHWIAESAIEDGDMATRTASDIRYATAVSVSHAWDRISVETIINSFNRVLFVNADEVEDFSEIQ